MNVMGSHALELPNPQGGSEDQTQQLTVAASSASASDLVGGGGGLPLLFGSNKCSVWQAPSALDTENITVKSRA